MHLLKLESSACFGKFLFQKEDDFLFHVSCLPFPVSKVSCFPFQSLQFPHLTRFSISIVFNQSPVSTFQLSVSQFLAGSADFLRTPPTTQKNQMAHLAVGEWLVSGRSPGQLMKSISEQFPKKKMKQIKGYINQIHHRKNALYMHYVEGQSFSSNTPIFASTSRQAKFVAVEIVSAGGLERQAFVVQLVSSSR